MMPMRAVSLYTLSVTRSLRKKASTLFSRKYLLYTNTGISVIMSCIGDGLQQKYQLLNKEIASWDKRRSRDVAITGFLVGPFCHFWYLFLDRWLPGRTLKIVAQKLLVDQLICSPIAITSFLSVTTYLEGKRGQEFKNELMEKGKTLYTAEWIIWPPAQVINFFLLPTKYRVLFDNSVSFFFDWYSSYVKYGKSDGKSDDPEDALEESNKETLTDKAVNIQSYGSHVPFLHIQAANLVQLKINKLHWDHFNEGFGNMHNVHETENGNNSKVASKND